MTNMNDAIKIAQDTAIDEGWPWKGSIHASTFRKWLMIGETYWEVISNVESKGRNVRILIEGSTGKVIRKSFLQR